MIEIASPEFRKRLGHAVLDCVVRYDEMSRMGRWRAPESWIQSALAQDLMRDFGVMLEVQTSELSRWHEKAQIPDLRNGRIDLVLFDRSAGPDPRDWETVALIEVKKCATKYDCASDIKRLDVIARTIELDSGAIVVAYLQETSQHRLRTLKDELVKELGEVGDLTYEEFPSEKSGACYSGVLIADLLSQSNTDDLAKLAALRAAIEAGLASGVADDFSFAKLRAELDREAEQDQSESAPT
jgi:hypothetical protein